VSFLESEEKDELLKKIEHFNQFHASDKCAAIIKALQKENQLLKKGFVDSKFIDYHEKTIGKLRESLKLAVEAINKISVNVENDYTPIDGRRILELCENAIAKIKATMGEG
jgi:acetoin utilization deacetylase AcuC-like enzyme